MANNSSIKFVHTNIVSKNWKKLAQFYIDVFNCKPLYPERNLSGEWLDKLTNIENAKIRGIHLELPGYSPAPTLEIFEYENNNSTVINPKINSYGLAHIAFHVDDVQKITNKVLENGGRLYGELVTKKVEGIGILTVVYTTDPEGNIIEIQNWKK
ncbi:MAG: glyoxalase [Bacteroidetes bacterium GWA2_30_7]|nr:MAG: glyoxalase [Bacteroidetes bacterium GWA2_30_7]